MATEQELIKAISEIDNVETLRSIFGAIANALRAKGINQNPIYPNEFAGLIGTIETGIDISDGTAVPSDLAKDKIAYSQEGRIVGNLNVKGGGKNDPTTILESELDSSVMYENLYVFASVSRDAIYRAGARIGIPTPLSSFGSATADKVLKGETFTSAAGMNVSGTYVPPETGTDTSDATATASDIASGKIAYGASGKITGNVTEVASGATYSTGNTTDLSVSGSYLYVKNALIAARLMRSGAIFNTYTALSNFGDATAADVVSGKTFTSSAGLKVTGTLFRSFIVDLYKGSSLDISLTDHQIILNSGFWTSFGCSPNDIKYIFGLGRKTWLYGWPSDLAGRNIVVGYFYNDDAKSSRILYINENGDLNYANAETTKTTNSFMITLSDNYYFHDYGLKALLA